VCPSPLPPIFLQKEQETIKQPKKTKRTSDEKCSKDILKVFFRMSIGCLFGHPMDVFLSKLQNPKKVAVVQPVENFLQFLESDEDIKILW
jgi:hypothetical protein